MMPYDYEQYERACHEIRRKNSELLEEFSGWLRQKGLSEKTIKRHSQNIDFYINEYLLYEEPTLPEEGTYRVGSFLGYWFIRKAMWASQSSIKENAASLKKFYQFMLERGRIEEDALEDLKEDIKEGLPEWLATLRRYDDPSIEDPEEIWGF